jgi:hypothetical protein
MFVCGRDSRRCFFNIPFRNGRSRAIPFRNGNDNRGDFPFQHDDGTALSVPNRMAATFRFATTAAGSSPARNDRGRPSCCPTGIAATFSSATALTGTNRHSPFEPPKNAVLRHQPVGFSLSPSRLPLEGPMATGTALVIHSLRGPS